MDNQKEALKRLERKLIGARRGSTFNNSFWISGTNEVKHLMGGHATELIEKCWVSFSDDDDENDGKASIYGVVAANRERRRYVWIYLHYHHHLWRVHSIKDAYEIIEKIKVHNELKKNVDRLRNKINRSEIQVCNN